MPLLEVKNLKTYFGTGENIIPAVDGLSFTLNDGEILAIVGESGCGKSMTALSILNLIKKPGRIIDGSILYRGADLTKKNERELSKIRGKEISMIFQEPTASLNPVFKVGRQIMDSLIYHEPSIKKGTAREEAIKLLKTVGIPAPEMVIHYYPHQLSGGMCQRVMIAMALACNPKILIADEPTTALDVTIQAQILSLIKDLNRQTNTAVILITHDFGVVAQTAENVMVMYTGQAVEQASVKKIFKAPSHPYTKGLLKALPRLNEESDRLYSIKGSVPSPSAYKNGCRFAPRCAYQIPLCHEKKPELLPAFNDDGHLVRCLRQKEVF